MRIVLAPLRSRPEEIAPLTLNLTRASGCVVTPAALRLLEGLPWPGNVRQLEMVVRLALASAAMGGTLDTVHLLPHVGQPEQCNGVHGLTSLRDERLAAERNTLERVLQEHDGVVAEAARALGISRQSFYKALRRTGLMRTNRDLMN